MYFEFVILLLLVLCHCYCACEYCTVDMLYLAALATNSINTYRQTYAPCGLRGCKNGPAPFPGRMSYKATKPGLDFLLYLSMFFLC